MFITDITTIVFAVAGVDLGNALGVLAGEFSISAGPVMVLAVLALVTAVTTVVVVVAHPSLLKRNKIHLNKSINIGLLTG